MEEAIWIGVLILSGILIFTCLTSSTKASVQAQKILYLFGAFICAEITFEAIIHIAYVEYKLISLLCKDVLRFAQVVMSILGVLMILSVLVSKDEPLVKK